MSCTGTLDTGSLGTTAAAGDQLLPAAKVSARSGMGEEKWGLREAGRWRWVRWAEGRADSTWRLLSEAVLGEHELGPHQLRD